MKENSKEESLWISYNEYKSLTDASNLLDCLNQVGVYSWSKYGEALNLYEEKFEELNFDED